MLVSAGEAQLMSRKHSGHCWGERLAAEHVGACPSSDRRLFRVHTVSAHTTILARFGTGPITERILGGESLWPAQVPKIRLFGRLKRLMLPVSLPR